MTDKVPYSTSYHCMCNHIDALVYIYFVHAKAVIVVILVTALWFWVGERHELIREWLYTTTEQVGRENVYMCVCVCVCVCVWHARTCLGVCACACEGGGRSTQCSLPCLNLSTECTTWQQPSRRRTTEHQLAMREPCYVSSWIHLEPMLPPAAQTRTCASWSSTQGSSLQLSLDILRSPQGCVSRMTWSISSQSLLMGKMMWRMWISVKISVKLVILIAVARTLWLTISLTLLHKNSLLRASLFHFNFQFNDSSNSQNW